MLDSPVFTTDSDPQKVQSPPEGSIRQTIASHTVGVTLRSVTKKYGSFTAIENINLTIPAGSYCCLLGPSGCGKTTTLRMIAGHEEATSGDILIGETRVNDLSPAQRNTAMVFQNYALFPHKTVWQNVEFGMRMRGIAQRERSHRTGEMLEIVGLTKFADRKPTMLSGGQQQRVALARALVTRPQVLLLDEPLSALDENMRVKTRGELRRLQKEFGMTFIQVTHDQDEAFALSDHIVVMDHGHVDQIGTPEAIFNAPASRFVARFVGDNNIFVGKVSQVTPNQGHARIQLEVDNVGTFLCRGTTADVGMTAACCVRSDRMSIAPAPDSPATTTNQIMAQITAIEFTGYVIRVVLATVGTGEEIVYKTHAHDWLTHSLSEGQSVILTWAVEDCIFLSH
jgi:putative spermidine/putrescine transport system ATP-binding protein